MQGWKTVLGLFIAFIGTCLNAAGISGPELTQIGDGIIVAVDTVLQVAGLAVALYGRIVASGTIFGGPK